jgi:PhnB protein
VYHDYVMMPYAGTPAEKHVDASWRDKIVQASMVVNGQRIMWSDGQAHHAQKPHGYSAQLQVETVEEAARIYNAMSEGGKIGMPLGETFRAQRFATFVDRFGTSCMMNCPVKS